MPARLPDGVAELRNTSRRKPAGLDLAPGRPRMPSDMPLEAAKLWQKIVPQLAAAGAIAPIDGPALRALCESWALYRRCAAEVDRDGPSVEGYRGVRVKHPSLATLKDSLAQFDRLAREFGLTPASRERLPKPPPPGDDFETILSIA